MYIGYARVSTHEQNLDLQQDASGQSHLNHKVKLISRLEKRSGIDQVWQSIDFIPLVKLDAITLQDALQQVGCKRIIIDRVSGIVAERPGLRQIKDLVRAGDTLVVWRLDRLGRSIKNLIEWVHWLEQEGAGLKSLQEAIDTTSTGGRLTFHIFAALAEFERQLIRERTHAGLRAARARGRLGGRPKALTASKQKRAVELYQEKQLAVQEICKIMGISKPTLYAYVRQAQASS